MYYLFEDSFLYGPLELDPYDDREEMDFDAADVLSSTQLCDVVNDRGPEDNEVERDVAGISKSFENENVEMASKDPKSMNEVNVAESSSSTFAGVESRKRNASGSSNGKVFCLVFYCLEMD